MSKFTYKTKDGTEGGFIVGFGEIKDGTISSDTPIENANLELVSGEQPQNAPVVGVASQQNPSQPETAGDAAEDKSNEQGVDLG